MKKLPFALPFALPLAVLVGSGLILPAHAQSFGDFLKNAAADAARHAVADNVRQAVTGAVDSAARSITQPGAANAPAPSAAAQPVAAAAPAGPVLPPGCAKVYGKPLAIGARPASYQPDTLWPDTACPVSNYRDLKFEKASAAKQAYVEASKVACKDCEGGYWPEAWGWRALVAQARNGDYSAAFAQLLVALKEGESLSWKGDRYDGKVTATGAHPIGELPCRQFHYQLSEKGRPVAEYDGLWCEYKGPYSAKASWHEKV